MKVKLQFSNHFSNQIKIRTKCEWYEHGEKSSKFFLNLEKSHVIQSQVRTVIYNDKETNDETEINNHIYSFFKYLYKETLHAFLVII